MADSDRWPEIEALYRAGFGRFARVAGAIVGDRDAAIDAVQEGFADALRHAGQWSGRGSLDAWVWRCVVNRARKARPRRHDLLVANGDGQDLAPDPELRAQLAALPERQRLVVFLRYFADLSYEQIADALGVRTGTVSATLNAAHHALRAALEEVPA